MSSDQEPEATATRLLARAMEFLGAEQVEANYGARCGEYVPDCVVCRAWRLHEDLMAFFLAERFRLLSDTPEQRARAYELGASFSGMCPLPTSDRVGDE